MAGRIPENILEDILGRADIVEVISGYLTLKKAGRNFKANCPFHHEKTASFMVSPDRQIYHCFGCGESGNAFKFLMRHERMDFPEAVEVLAKKTGVNLPRQDDKETVKAASLSEQLYKVNQLALMFYENNLKSASGQLSRDYLLKRSLTDQTIQDFHLGLAPSGWDNLINFLRNKNVPLSVLEAAGLILTKDGGGYYDRFRNRIIFPIFDIRSRVIGFGARVLDNSLPKYVNSPETKIYVKGRNLFGLNLSKDFIRDADCAIIVEGYLDFIVPYQEGIKNIVASQGTALTAEQIKLLKRYTQNVVMVYDGDAAGEMATLRSLDLLIDEGINVRVASLPKGMDPDTAVRKLGQEKFGLKIKDSLNFFDYKLNLLKEKYDINDAHGKSKIAGEMLSTINKFDNAILRCEYTKRLSEAIQIPEEHIFSELNKIKPKSSPETAQFYRNKQKPSVNPAEKLLIKFMLEEKELIEKIMQELSPSDFQDERTAKIMLAIQEIASQGKKVHPSILMNYFSEDEQAELVCETIFMPDLNETERQKAVNDCINRIKVERLKNRRENLHREIKNAQVSGDEQKLKVLIHEFHNLIKKGD